MNNEQAELTDLICGAPVSIELSPAHWYALLSSAQVLACDPETPRWMRELLEGSSGRIADVVIPAGALRQRFDARWLAPGAV